jgi:CRISPR/Cas system-associated exonuclease Cas4 (RecB family)
MTQGPFSHWRKAIEDHEIKEESSGGRPDLPPYFQFSQNSLQDYVDCARRFQLRFVLNQRWPAAETEPLQEQERLIEEGAQFHLMVQRHLLGIPAEKLIPLGADLEQWWQSYLTTNPLGGLPATFRRPEVQLSTILSGQRIMARFDLLCIEPGERAVIVDWKTSRYRPDRQMMAQRLQSRVYPFVLAEAGAHLFGGPIIPEQISLIYWFANEHTRPEAFVYERALHDENREFLSRLIQRVIQQSEDVWPLTDDWGRCKYCVYRSLCDRGVKGGTLEELTAEVAEPTFDFDFTIEDIDEIAF